MVERGWHAGRGSGLRYDAVNAEDRVVGYAATTGGYVKSDRGRFGTLVASAGDLVNAGIYRCTSRNLQVMKIKNLIR